MVFQGGGLHGCPGWGIAWLSRVGVAWLFRVGGCMVVRGGGVMVVRGGGCHGCPGWGFAWLSGVGGRIIVQGGGLHGCPVSPHPPAPGYQPLPITLFSSCPSHSSSTRSSYSGQGFTSSSGSVKAADESQFCHVPTVKPCIRHFVWQLLSNPTSSPTCQWVIGCGDFFFGFFFGGGLMSYWTCTILHVASALI